MKDDSMKSGLIGGSIGLAPLVVAAILFYALPALVDGNAGSLGSFAVLALYVVSCIGVFVISVILMIKNQAVKGGAALASLFLQAVVIFYFLAY